MAYFTVLTCRPGWMAWRRFSSMGWLAAIEKLVTSPGRFMIRWSSARGRMKLSFSKGRVLKKIPTIWNFSER